MSWAARYIGLEFAELGRGPKYDCWGLTQLIYRTERGIALPSYTESYSTTQDEKGISQKIIQERMQHWREVSSPEEFDVVLIRMRGLPMHVGVAINSKTMSHITDGINASIEDFTRMRWKNRLIGFYRYGAEG